MTILGSMFGAVQTATAADEFKYTDEQFADIQMLRYKVHGFERLTLRQQTLIYYLQEAALWGRDILFDQNGRYNLRIRRMLETVYTQYEGDRTSADFKAMEVYLKRVWFSSGIHHHYGCEKFEPAFSRQWLRQTLLSMGYKEELAGQPQHISRGPRSHNEQSWDELLEVMFSTTDMMMRVNQRDGDDLVLTSASNYYETGITQKEAEEFYSQRKPTQDPRPVMMGLNSRLERNEWGLLEENTYRVGGLYSEALEHIVYWLNKALPYADTPQQERVIRELIQFYQTGDLRCFDRYSILWLKDTESLVDFVNGFTETYGDPLGMKASWESLVNFKDLAATERTTKLSENAQWFEDNSPVDARFKKEECRGISAKVITAAILAGDLYPSTAIGINLPNSDWVRRDFGSKSVTIGNLTDAYNKASHGSGMDKEFVIDEPTRKLIAQYGDLTDDLHTDIHECLGHGSGKLLPGTDPDSLKAHGATIEETRADLFGLYYMADPKLVELGLTPNLDAYKAQYYTYMQNGLLTQLVRIKPGSTIEEAHMRNRALVARWVLARANGEAVQGYNPALKADRHHPAVELIQRKGKTYVRVNDYSLLRTYMGELLAEIQRIKSEGDYQAARQLVETYAVQIDPKLHQEILARYERLKLSPYKGFINPRYEATFDSEGRVTSVRVSYDEGYAEQMLRYSRDYRSL